jgi:hypothetical protein
VSLAHSACEIALAAVLIGCSYMGVDLPLEQAVADL